MRLRDTLILLGVLTLCAAAGILLATQDSLAVELPPSSPAGEVPADAVAHDGDTVAAPSEATAPTTAAVAVEANHDRRVDTAGWTSGVIRGDIQLAVSALDRIQSISVAVEEARQAVTGGVFRNPWRTIVPVQRGAGTPTFEVRDVPFSEFPYVVTVFSPGLNGSRRTLTIDAGTPLVDDVVLTITPGAPFSLLLRDQDQGPCIGVDVHMLPVGEPLGRQRHTGTSDNFGSVVFEDVLAGDYDVHTSIGGQKIGEPQRLSVQPGHTTFQASVRGQGHTLTIPRGIALAVRVHDTIGYGIAEATVKATATDRPRLTEVELPTDFGGNVKFEHLPPGRWQIDVFKDGFQRTHRIVTLRDGEPTNPVEFQLVRLR
ncbi:MAG: carboxypeptidase regulatory-like domain-containing protein [Planctomycetes bacterium]|nr:carboxypeptidase regulatory-like domain-containing protein [Planctomycetota bacterium]